MREPKKSSIFVDIKDFLVEIIIFFLELMEEIVWPLIKREAKFIFKEHPIVTVLIIIICILITTSVSMASEKHTVEVKESVKEIVEVETEQAIPVTTYKRVELNHDIKTGDTLLGLACKYSKNGESASEWISNVKQMNNLKSDWIIEGTKLKIYTWEEVTQ